MGDGYFYEPCNHVEEKASKKWKRELERMFEEALRNCRKNVKSE